MIGQFDGFEINLLHEGDAWKLCDFVVRNTDRLKRYFPITLSENLNPTLSEVYVQNKMKAMAHNEIFVFTIKHSEHRQLAGLVILKKLNWNIKQGEFAYCIDYRYEGQGIISKAIALLSTHALEILELKTLQIITHKDNVGSIKVATNNGYAWQETLKKSFTPTGELPLDMELYERYKN